MPSVTPTTTLEAPAVTATYTSLFSGPIFPPETGTGSVSLEAGSTLLGVVTVIVVLGLVLIVVGLIALMKEFTK